jgi:hypothetical protein
MTMRNSLGLLGISLALLTAAPVRAELYKWVDERGVTNYSNERPGKRVAAKKISRVETQLSVVASDEGFLRMMKALREQRIRALAEPYAERPVLQYAVPAQPAGRARP